MKYMTRAGVVVDRMPYGGGFPIVEESLSISALQELARQFFKALDENEGRRANMLEAAKTSVSEWMTYAAEITATVCGRLGEPVSHEQIFAHVLGYLEGAKGLKISGQIDRLEVLERKVANVEGSINGPRPLPSAGWANGEREEAIQVLKAELEAVGETFEEDLHLADSIRLLGKYAKDGLGG